MKLEDSKGSWALVTGASSGIGREFCQQLGTAGMHIVMVARRENLLNELADQLARDHGIRTLIIPLDLSRPGAAAQVKAQLDRNGVRVRLLCNNAGTGRWGKFEAISADTYEEMIGLNTTAVVSLCHHLLPDLTSHPTNAIINVSSPAAYQPVPFMAVYAATKAFVQSFSQALYGEWRDRGVLVQTLVPGPTATAIENATAVGKLRPPADAVRDALAHLGKDHPVVVSARGTYRQRLFSTLAPPKMVIRTVARMFQPPECDREGRTESAQPDKGA